MNKSTAGLFKILRFAPLKINDNEIIGVRKVNVSLGIDEVATVNIELIGKVNLDKLKTIPNINIITE